MGGGRPILLAAALGLMLVVSAGAARAQLSGSLSIDSDYRLRGVSLTGVRPVVTASVAYDHRSGLYAGGSVIGTATKTEGVELLGHSEYAGFAVRGAHELTWDVGVNHHDYTIYGPTEFRLKYTEIYAGVSRRNLTARVYFSPDYVASGSGTLYLSLDGVVRPAENWRVTAHAGLYKPLYGRWPRDRRARADFQLGVAREFGRAEIRIAAVAAAPAQWPRYNRSHPGVIAGASWFF